MENTQKVIVTPYEGERARSMPNLYPSDDPNVRYSSFRQQTNDTSSDEPVDSKKAKTQFQPSAKLFNQLIIALDLARVAGYDKQLRIQNENGNYIENSNVYRLLINATTPSKMLLGEQAFINLLFKAGVDPSLIANENVKLRLIKLYESHSTFQQQPSPPPPTSDNQKQEIYTTTAPAQNRTNAVPVITETRRGIKRKRQEEERDEDETPIKKADWLIPDQESQVEPENLPLPSGEDEWQ